ncbi:MAG: TolC family protein [Phycisphaeraceae bacterium]|nr:TolC family protein [Phycisphaeraceae bacterium]
MKKLTLTLALIASVNVVGCTNPLMQSMEDEMREHLIRSHRRHIQTIMPGEIELVRERSEVERDLGEREGRIEALDRDSGPAFYADRKLDLGRDLTGSEELEVVQLSLQQAIALAVENNIDLQAARRIPAIRRAQVTRAESIFDAAFFTNYNMSLLDTPRPESALFPGFGGPIQTDVHQLETGLRKGLPTGGQVQLSTQFQSTRTRPATDALETFWDTNIALSIRQPLLRGFGTDINTAGITLARSAQRQSIEELRATTIDLVSNVEAAYWSLVVRRQNVLILSRLLEQTRTERNRLRERLAFDVRPATYTEVLAREELRRAELIRAQTAVRQASDLLKRLINDPNLPITAETLILPMDLPPDLPVRFSLLDAVTTALSARPEMRTALMQIKDASVRQRVADNNRLPTLDLSATIRFNEQDNALGRAYADIFTESNFIDYLVSLQFEVPIGNRDAEALFMQRALERQQAALLYQRQSQDVVRQVKDAMRELYASYDLIGATRSSRRAAAESLRALLAEEEAGARLTPEFIDLKLRRQEALASAELQEIEAMAGYNNALSDFFRSMGTLLERNQIEVRE